MISGFWVEVLGFRVWGLGLRGNSLGFRIQGLEKGKLGSNFRVRRKGSWFWV